MRNAFTVRAVLKQLPVRIESATAYGDRLLLGTATGALLVYRVTEPTGDKLPTLSLVDTKKAFARKAVEQLGVIKEAGVLVCLADNLVTLYDLHSFSNATPLNNTKGANIIAIHTGVEEIDGIPTLVSKLAVHAKRKIVVLEWRNAEFYKNFEYLAAEKITSMQFASPGLLTLSTARDFLSLQLPRGQWDDLFPADTSSLRTLAGGFGAGLHSTGKADDGGYGYSAKGGGLEPASGLHTSNQQQQQNQASGSSNANANATGGSGSMWGSWALGLSGSSTETKTIIARMPGEKLLLCHKDIGVFINSVGKLCRQEYADPMSFIRAPSGITYTSSYAIAISSEASSTSTQLSSASGNQQNDSRFNVEVRNIATQALVQSLFLQDEQPLHVFNGSGGKQVWAVGMHTVWRLIPIPIQQQVEDVLNAGQYDEALSLVAQSDNILESEKEELTVKIRWLRARWLFRDQAKYDEALSEFTDLGATPTEVIALCPERIAGELSEQLSDVELNDGDGTSKGEDISSDTAAQKSAELRETKSTVDNEQVQQQQQQQTASLLFKSKKGVKQKQVIWKDALYAVMRYLTEHRRWLQRAMTENRREIGYVVRVLEDDDDQDYSDDGKGTDIEKVDSSTEVSRSSPASSRARKQIPREEQEDDSLPHVRLKRLAFSLERMSIPVPAMAQVVDTTLLKVYLECSPGLLGPLLRVKNYCDVEQSEGLLLEHKRYMELVDLYHGKGLYRNALQLLQTQGMASEKDGNLRGTYQVVRYLLRLPADQYELVLEYLVWPLQAGLAREQSSHADNSDKSNDEKSSDNDDEDDEDWLAPSTIVSMVFADDRPAAEAFPRARITSFLRQISPKLVVQYLAYVFASWRDDTPILHDDMVAAYLGLISEQNHCKSASVDGEHINEEALEQNFELRSQVQRFLKTSQQYSPEKALARLPDDGLFEERALVLSRLGRHEQALCLLVFSVANLAIAEQYCVDNLDSCASVFILLLRILLSKPPPDIADNEIKQIRSRDLPIYRELAHDYISEIDLESTREKIHRQFVGHLLSIYHQNISANDALRLLPADMEFTHDIFVYLRGQLCALDQDMRASNIVCNLRIGEDFQARRQLRRLQSGFVVISDTRTCPQCLKRIGSGTAFTVIPAHGKGASAPVVIHYSCWQRQKSAKQLAESTATTSPDSAANLSNDIADSEIEKSSIDNNTAQASCPIIKWA
ncbi:hypothetical protein BX070DRAFT_230506 [Coemansia spiralis]|nr:hypothetical protein BX070DRAFT_230506 [Coemansia spiralis]